jgi:hypothetical protein
VTAILRHHNDLYCDLGSIKVELDCSRRVYLFSITPYGVIYEASVHKVSQGVEAWGPELEEVLDVLRTFS